MWPDVLPAGIPGSQPALAGYFRRGMCAGWKEAGGRLRLTRKPKAFCRDFTGATGLEPATSTTDARSARSKRAEQPEKVRPRRAASAAVRFV